MEITYVNQKKNLHFSNLRSDRDRLASSHYFWCLSTAVLVWAFSAASRILPWGGYISSSLG